MKKTTILLLLTFVTIAVLSQPELKFERYDNYQGLVQDDIQSICQDKYGFIWFGTKKGCSRFDGIKFTNYIYDKNDSFSIGYGWIKNIICDKNGQLWFAITGKNKALMRYDYEKDHFVNYADYLLDFLKLDDDAPFSLTNIFPDKEGNIWISGSNTGLLCFNPDTEKFKSLNSYLKKEEVRPFLRDVYDDGNNLWFITSRGILIFDRNKDSLIYYKKNINNPYSISSDNCTCIFRDSKNQIWIGTYHGLNRLISLSSEPGKSTFEQYLHDSHNPNSLSGNLVYDIKEDQKGNILVATTSGLTLIDEKNRIYRYQNDEIDNESINSNLIRTIFRDKDKTIWIGTNSGVGKLKKKNFRSYSHSSYKNSISHNKIQHFCEGPNSEVWIATPKGIDILNREMGKFRFYKGTTRDENGLFGAPISLFADADKGMWVATWAGGLSFIDYKTNKLTNYITRNGFENIKNCLAVVKDKMNNVWFNEVNKGLYRFNLATNELVFFSSVSDEQNTLSSNQVSSIFIDSGDNIWIGTLNGLNKIIDRTKGTFQRYLKNIEINCMYERKDKNFLIGTNSGLFHLNTSTETFRKYDMNDGLPNNIIYGILEDDNSKIWISSIKGFARIAINQDSTLDVTKYRREEGLNSEGFLPGAYIKLSDGTMMFGTSKGFCMFHPDYIINDTLTPTVVLTNFKVANKIIKVGQSLNGQVLLRKSLMQTKQLTINHKNNGFSIEFAGLQYNMPQYNQYAYRLDGFDTVEWNYSSAGKREVEYMNLHGGDYVFRVKASNSYGVWSDKQATLNIHILPPWWRTWWFRITLLIVVITGFISFYRYRLNALKRQKRILEQKVYERTQELREANSQLEEKQEEILQQNEELITKNDEIQQQKEELEAKNEEIESSKQKLEKAFNNITILSEFGQKLTATFDFDEINKMIYNYVRSLMNTSAFGIGIFNEKRKIIDFPYFMENGKPLPYFFKALSSEKSLSVKCFKEKQEIIINDLPVEYKKYLGDLPEVQTSELPSSIIHIPLVIENKPIGTITVNSFKPNAYNDNDVANLRTLASYISIALDNSKAYRIIRSKNEQISGSIRYGQTIQKAMLPPKKQLDSFFENFVIFRPKDIVSGDFYWFASVKNLEGLDSDKQRNLQGLKNGLNIDNNRNLQGFDKGLNSDKRRNQPPNPEGLNIDNNKNLQGLHNYYFLAIVDCTGHGVPGAFMSMIGSRLLNDIIMERKIYSPAKILDQLNTMIRKALRQETTDNNDGMDLCLCRFQNDGAEWEMTYAGAKRSLILYDSASNGIEEIHGTRRSIGGFMRRNKIIEFTEETRKVNAGDVFYLSTDGLVDQCNPQKRKFSQKKLTELLHKIHHKPLNEQKQDIEKTLDDFQGGFEQRDDITLVGVKLATKQSK